LLTYKMADVLMFSMSKVLFDRELGIPTDVRGILNAFSMVASIGGAILGALWISKRSLGATLFTITLLMALTEPLFVGLAAFAPELAISEPGTATSMSDIAWSDAIPGLSAVTVVIVLEQICGGFATAAQMVFIMRRCDPNHRAAHYAFATAIYSIPQMIVGGYSGHFYENLGSVNYYWLVTALTIPAVVLSRHVPTD
jgi:PAT family beta-lactamase induction signal transducer AmpG